MQFLYKFFQLLKIGSIFWLSELKFRVFPTSLL